MIIYIDELSVKSVIGVYEEERHAPQELLVSVQMEVSDELGITDKIDATVDYDNVTSIIQTIAKNGAYALIEKMAHDICDELMKDERILGIELDIAKPNAIKYADNVGVVLSRSR